VKKTTGFYPRPSVDTAGRAAVGQAGGVLLTSTVKAAGLDAGLSAALVPWRPLVRPMTQLRSCWTWR
jgi:hypothetical protein